MMVSGHGNRGSSVFALRKRLGNSGDQFDDGMMQIAICG